MDIEKGWIVALIFVLLVGGANLLAYALVRGAFRTDDKSILKRFTQNLNAVQKKKESDIEELSRRVNDLRGGKSDTDDEAD